MSKKKSTTVLDRKKSIPQCVEILNAVSESTLQSLLIIDRDYFVIYYNNYVSGNFNFLYPKKLKIGDCLLEFLNEDDKKTAEKYCQKAFAGRTVTTEKEFAQKGNKTAVFNLRFSPVKENRGRKIKYICIALIDLTHLKHLETSLTENKKNLTETQHLGRIASFKMEYPYGEVYWSRETADILGIDLYNNPINIYEFLHFVHPGDKDKLISKIEDSIINHDKFQIVFRFMKDENIRFIQMIGHISIKGKADKAYVIGTVIDITDYKKAEEKVRNILVENEILLKEIQHRVKNNFQVMLSLLSLQARHIKDKDFQEIFKVSQNRIKSLALVYEKLYYSKELSKIDFAEYVNQLIKNLVYVYNLNPIRTTIKINAENVQMDLLNAVPCGLIINELVSNSMKHAFPDNREGEISVTLVKKDNNIELSVSDNGIGIPTDINYKSTETLGLQLVITLVAQIDGLINYDNSKGSLFTITFPFKSNIRLETPERIL